MVEPTTAATAWDQRYSGAELVWSAGPNLWVEQFTAPLPAGRALDLAAGEGRNAIWLVERGWSATAVDFSAVGLDRARAVAAQRLGEAAQRLDTQVADLLTYQPEPSFDLVLVVYLQLPESARRSAIQMAARALTTGGTLLVVAHDSDNLAHGVGGPSDAAVLYTPADITGDLAGTQVEIVHAETMRRPVQTPEGTRFALDAVVVARAPGQALPPAG